MTWLYLCLGGFLAAFVAAVWALLRLGAEADAERQELLDSHSARSVTR